MHPLEQFFSGNTGLNISKEHQQMLAVTAELHRAADSDRVLFDRCLQLCDLMGADSPVSKEELTKEGNILHEVRSKIFTHCCLHPGSSAEIRGAFPGAFQPRMEMV